ncbi:MAG: hypothetical protein AAFY26_22515 [Cyanobacteria bacterium J06638_22]
MKSSDNDRQKEIDWNEKMVESRLRNLAANLMRIARGSGKLHEVEAQVMDLANELAKHRELTSHGVSPHIYQQALLFDPEIRADDKDIADRRRARATIVQGALQFAASEMLDQNTFRSKGDEEISEGVRLYEAWRKQGKSAVSS